MTQASSLFEEILITPQDTIDKETLLEALHAAAGPYKELKVFNSELMTLHSQHVPPSKRARSGDGKGKIDVKAIKDTGKPVGFKASGGIRTLADAQVYLDIADEIMGPDWASPDTFRFGASGLLDALLAALTEEGA